MSSGAFLLGYPGSNSVPALLLCVYDPKNIQEQDGIFLNIALQLFIYIAYVMLHYNIIIDLIYIYIYMPYIAVYIG